MDDGGRGEDMDENVWERVERALDFLDTWSVILPDGSTTTNVYRNETHKTVP